MAETSSIEYLGKIKVSASIEVYAKNATLANFQTVVRNYTTKCRMTKRPISETMSEISYILT